jgi:hypothetical protein
MMDILLTTSSIFYLLRRLKFDIISIHPIYNLGRQKVVAIVIHKGICYANQVGYQLHLLYFYSIKGVFDRLI